jgi:hypothetical protein
MESATGEVSAATTEVSTTATHVSAATMSAATAPCECRGRRRQSDCQTGSAYRS